VRVRHGTWLALSAAAYAACHHLGSLPDGIGAAPYDTRWTDWLDLLVPFVVLAPALMTLVSAQVGRPAYAAFAVGACLDASGHGIHLSANSVGNVAPGQPAYLWDEHVGHAIWYAGVAVVAATLASTMAGRRTGWVAWPLALAVGATWGTNATGGHFTVPGALVAVLALGWGLVHRRDQRLVLALAGGAALVAIGVSTAVR
jgi:hypothetical protein